MGGLTWGMWVTGVVALSLGAACEARALEPDDGGVPGGDVVGRGPLPPPLAVDTTSALKMLAGPDAQLLLGVNGGAVSRMGGRDVHFMARDVGELAHAAATVGMPVCTIELDALAGLTPYGVNGVKVADALARCQREDLGNMMDQLSGLKTPETVVVIAANTGITVHTTNDGINLYYDADILRMLRAARKLDVAACIVVPEPLTLGMPEGSLAPGLSLDDALARCGRSY